MWVHTKLMCAHMAHTKLRFVCAHTKLRFAHRPIDGPKQHSGKFHNLDAAIQVCVVHLCAREPSEALCARCVCNMSVHYMCENVRQAKLLSVHYMCDPLQLFARLRWRRLQVATTRVHVVCSIWLLKIHNIREETKTAYRYKMVSE